MVSVTPQSFDYLEVVHVVQKNNVDSHHGQGDKAFERLEVHNFRNFQLFVYIFSGAK